MSNYVRPTFAELLARIDVDLSAVPAALRTPLSAAWARACNGQHGHLDWIAAQCSPLTCDLDRLYQWAALYDVDRLPAVAATGSILCTGTTGAQVLAEARWRGSNGLDYAVTAAETLASDGARVMLQCTSPGAAGNLPAGEVLTAVNPIAGVLASATVMPGGLSGGADNEALDDWRVRVADEWQTAVLYGGRAGRIADYRAWARAAHPSVTGALVQLHTLGFGTVVVRPVCAGLADRLPTQGVMDAVLAYLQTRAPGDAEVHVCEPLLRPVLVSIHLPPTIDSGPVRAAAVASLQAMVAANLSEDAVLSLAEMDAAIGAVATQFTRSTPVVPIAVGPGEIFAMPVVTWL